MAPLLALGSSMTMAIALAQRMQSIQPFYVMAVLARAQKLEAEGRDVIHMEVGEPDFDTPEPVKVAAKQAIDAGWNKYTPATGLPELRQAIAGYYQSRFQVTIAPERVAVTVGASAALLSVLSLLCNSGEGVLMPEPGYPCNRHFLSLLGADYQGVPVTQADNFQLTPAHLDHYWQPHTRAAMVATPSNPTGSVMSQDELDQLYQAVKAKSGQLIVDEIYQGLCYGAPETTALSIADDVFVINSFSKFFGMTGWRVGWCVLPEEVVPEIEKLLQNLFIAPPAMSQHAALAALAPDTLAILEQRRQAFEERRQVLKPALESLGIQMDYEANGAFYLYGDVSAFCDDSYDFCIKLLEHTGVAATPGIDFGSRDAHRYIRFAYTQPVPRLEQAVERIESFLRAGA